jgi:ankyrin repeat protein
MADCNRRGALAKAAFLLVAGAAVGVPALAGSFDDFFRALKQDDVEALSRLARRGFDLNTRNETGEPPLLVAIRAEAIRAASWLAEQRGVDLDALNAKDENALMLAALRGQPDLLRLLVERGAEANKPGWTPLHYAATHNGAAAAAMVELLLEHHAYIDAASPNGTTPLMMAARYGDIRALGLLLNGGADPTLKNEQGLDALDFARAARRRDAFERIERAMQAWPQGPAN